jgi:hypothetical protein
MPLVNRQAAEDFPAEFSRVVIRLAKDTRAKPNANTRKFSPDKCLVVPSLSTGLRPGCPRNTAANAVTTRKGFASSVASVLFGVPASQFRVACQFDIQLNKSTQFRVNICHQMVSIPALRSLFFTGYAGDSIRRGV